MKKTHTILIPNMAITQFRLLEYALRYDGYKCEILGNCGSAVAQLGLKYVHNDTCYPALLVIGQFLDEDGVGQLHLRGKFGIIVFHRFLLCIRLLPWGRPFPLPPRRAPPERRTGCADGC